jgi:hypothetical protein
MLNLESIAGGTIPAGTKGLPPAAAGRPQRDPGLRGYNLLAGDIPLPACCSPNRIPWAWATASRSAARIPARPSTSGAPS